MEKLYEEPKIERVARIIEFDKLAKHLKNLKNLFLILPQQSLTKNIKAEPLDLTIKNKIMLYYNELPFGIIYFCSYLNIEIMNIISLDTEME